MGSSLKTVQRIMQLTNDGHLPAGGAICDIGATQLFGDNAADAVRGCLAFYAERTPKAKRPADVPEETVKRIADGGFLGDLLLLAGFDYLALDIFHAVNTVLFDLNIHEPGPALAGRFDLVMNLGTTEHVFNQLRAFQTIHDLCKVGGVIYHDLPLAGYVDHALFRYDPLFFQTLVAANPYEVLFEEISIGAEHTTPRALRAKGYSQPSYIDMGIEFIVKRHSAEAFRIPLETTTSLSVDPEFERVVQDGRVRLPEGTAVTYGAANAFHDVSVRHLTGLWVRRIGRAMLRRIAGMKRR